jgi:hypothetical protein
LIDDDRDENIHTIICCNLQVIHFRACKSVHIYL